MERQIFQMETIKRCSYFIVLKLWIPNWIVFLELGKDKGAYSIKWPFTKIKPLWKSAHDYDTAGYIVKFSFILV